MSSFKRQSVYDQVEGYLNDKEDSERARRMFHYFARKSAEWFVEMQGWQTLAQTELIAKHRRDGFKVDYPKVDAVWLVDEGATPNLPKNMDKYPPELLKVEIQTRPLIVLYYAPEDYRSQERGYPILICPIHTCRAVNTVEDLGRVTGWITHDKHGAVEMRLEKCSKCGQHWHREHVWNLD